jgi:hypothetical protein
MSFINYIEPVSIGEMFSGLGILLIAGVLCYIFYRLYIKFIQYIDLLINREAKYEILEERMLDKIGKKKGIDLEKELVKRKMFDKNKKSFRRKIAEQVYEEMFGKKTEE